MRGCVPQYSYQDSTKKRRKSLLPPTKLDMFIEMNECLRSLFMRVFTFVGPTTGSFLQKRRKKEKANLGGDGVRYLVCLE